MALDDASDACPKRCCCTAAAGWATSNGTVEFGASGDDGGAEADVPKRWWAGAWRSTPSMGERWAVPGLAATWPLLYQECEHVAVLSSMGPAARQEARPKARWLN